MLYATERRGTADDGALARKRKLVEAHNSVLKREMQAANMALVPAVKG